MHAVRLGEFNASRARCCLGVFFLQIVFLFALVSLFFVLLCCVVLKYECGVNVGSIETHYIPWICLRCPMLEDMFCAF